MSSSYKVIELCESLGIKRQNYYYKAHPRQIPESQIKAVKRVFLESHRAYGAEKITKQLQRDGMSISPKTVSKIMRCEGLVSKYIQKRKKCSKNQTNRDEIPDRLWGLFCVKMKKQETQQRIE